MDNPVRVKKLAGAQAVAVGACAGRIVEGKKSRLKFCEVITAVRAGIARRKEHLPDLGFVLLVPGQYLHQGEAVSDGESRLK